MNKKVNKYALGQHQSGMGKTLRVMAFVEGWYMARWKGNTPFVCDEIELERRLNKT